MKQGNNEHKRRIRGPSNEQRLPGNLVVYAAPRLDIFGNLVWGAKILPSDRDWNRTIHHAIEYTGREPVILDNIDLGLQVAEKDVRDLSCMIHLVDADQSKDHSPHF